ILGNLLDNAFKYGRKKVSFSANAMVNGEQQSVLQLWVEDDGPGIASEQWQNLLQRGTRGDERVEGHGLGLAIVLELMSAYGGSMGIGKSELGGARIELEIPLA